MKKFKKFIALALLISSTDFSHAIQNDSPANRRVAIKAPITIKRASPVKRYTPIKIKPKRAAPLFISRPLRAQFNALKAKPVSAPTKAPEDTRALKSQAAKERRDLFLDKAIGMVPNNPNIPSALLENIDTNNTAATAKIPNTQAEEKKPVEKKGGWPWKFWRKTKEDKTGPAL